MHQIVFAGDSLIENFPLNELYCGEKIIYNRGIAGSSTYDLLARLDRLIIPLLAGQVFLLIGTNDFFPHIVNNDEVSIARRIIQVCDRIKKSNETCQVHVFSLFPINTSDNQIIYHDWLVGKDNLKIDRVNRNLRMYCNEKGYTYIDVYPLLIDPTGQLDINYTLDGIHINVPAYKIVFDATKMYL